MLQLWKTLKENKKKDESKGRQPKNREGILIAQKRLLFLDIICYYFQPML